MDYERHFARFGFIHVPQAIAPDEVMQIREKLHDLFAKADAVAGRTLRDFDSRRAILELPWLYELCFKPRIVEALKVILGQHFQVVFDLMVARNQCGGWHLDASGEGKQPYLYDRNYRFVKCGIYLQENTEQYGGGVDFVPGAHRFPLITPSVPLNFKLKTAYEILAKKIRATRAKLGPGDFLAFHSCLPHQSTYPKAWLDRIDSRSNMITGVPRDMTKYAIYWDACRQGWAAGYFQRMSGNADDELRARDPTRRASCAEMLSLHFPEDYPAHFLELLRRHGVGVASIDRQRAKAYRAKLGVS